MNSIKNAIVTITLLVVGYGSYVILREPEPGPFVDAQTPSAANADLAPVDFAMQGSFTQPPIQDDSSPSRNVVDLKAKAEPIAGAVGSRFDSFNRNTPQVSPGASRFESPTQTLTQTSTQNSPLLRDGPKLKLPQVKLEDAASSVASTFEKAKDTVAQKAQEVQQTLDNSFDNTLSQAKVTFSNQFENVKSQAKDLAKSAADFGASTREQLESKLPALPKLVESSSVKLPELAATLSSSPAAEVEPESQTLEASPKPEFRQLQPKDVAPDKAPNEISVSNVASNVPPPFANRLEAGNPLERAAPANSSQDQMPVLPRVDDWEPYVGPPLSAADLEAGVDLETLEAKARTAAELSSDNVPTNNSLEVVEPGLVLPAETSTPTVGEKLQPFAEPINPPVAVKTKPKNMLRAEPSESFAANATVTTNTNFQGTAAESREAASSNSPQTNLFSSEPKPSPPTQPVATTRQDQTTPSYLNTDQAKPPVKLTPPSQTTPPSLPARPKLPTKPNPTFEKVWAEVQGQLKKRDYPRALRTLTPWSSESDLNKEQATRCIRLLDQLAGTIIYSRQSFLEPQYQVKAGETLEEIAAQYGVPQELIAKINGVAPPYALMTGEKLKVVRGPFRATISLSRQELTLYVGPNYAGRFPVLIGPDLPPESAFYEVAEKLEGRTYFDRKLGREIIRSETINRYGKHWLGLRGEHITTGHSVGIHGRPAQFSKDDVGSLSLAAKDAADVFSILSIGSRVEVRP